MRAGPSKTGDERLLRQTLGDLVQSAGRDVLARAEGVASWRDARLRAGVWSWTRSVDGPPGPRTTVRNEAGIASYGLSFVIQDPLALATHPVLFDAALEALQRYGPHAPGSPCFTGVTPSTRALEAAVTELLGLEHVVLFPSGWAAAFGTLTALLRPDDHIVIDELAHPSLQAGAVATTRHIHRHRHGDPQAVRDCLRAIRDADTEAAIVVVTETFFAFESDTPDLAALDAACRAYDATLMPACGHDLGTMGSGGTGMLGIQGVLDGVDLVVGSFAKAFAGNGGFLATRSPDVKHWVRFAASTHAHSNALSPLDTAVVTEAIRIVRADEGDQRRNDLARAVVSLRQACTDCTLPHVGLPSALTLIPTGAVDVARAAECLAGARGAFVNVIEEPFLPPGHARIALHATAAHRPEHVREAIDIVTVALADAGALCSAGRG